MSVATASAVRRVRFTSTISRALPRATAASAMAHPTLPVPIMPSFMAGLQAGSSRSARRRGHKFRADRIGDRFAQDPIDLSLGRGVEPPASHLADRFELTGMTRAPQRRGYTLIENPADGELNNVLAEALLSELIEPLHRREILRESGLLELWVSAPQIVAGESRIGSHSSGQKTSA